MKQIRGSSKESQEPRGDRTSVARVMSLVFSTHLHLYSSGRHLELGFVRGWTFQIKECF